MTKQRDATEDKAAELRELIRAANEVLGDLRRERKEIAELVKTSFDEHVAAHAARAEKIVAERLNEFCEAMKGHNNDFQQAIMNRWAHIESMCAADNYAARMIALHVLKDNDGTVTTGKGSTYHLVKETQEDDGRPSFAFPRSMGQRATQDPVIEKAVRRAVREHRPDIDLLEFEPPPFQKGPNKE